MKNKEIPLLIAEFKRASLKAESSTFGTVAYYMHHAIPSIKNISLYLRFRTRQQALWTRPALVFSNINIYNERQGTFKELLAHTKELCKERGWVLQIENVLPPEFRDYLTREGFKTYGFDADSTYGSMYWIYDEAVLENDMHKQTVYEIGE